MRQILPCLRDFITAGTVAECEFLPSISGLYFTDIAGVTGSLLANLAHEEDTTIALLSERVLARAMLRFKELLNGAMFSSGYALREGYIKTKNVCKFSAVTTPSLPLYRGLTIRKPSTGLPEYTAYFVNSLQLRAAQSGTTTVEIRDADGLVLWSKPVTVTANNTLLVQVQKELIGELFYVVWDTTLLDTFDTTCASTNTGCTPCNKSTTDRYAIQGWDGLQQVNNRFGIIVDGGAQCSFDAFICANISYFASAVIALCEAEIFTALQRSNRLNHDTIYQDPSTVSGFIEKAKNTAAKRIKEQLSVLLPTMQKNAPYCLTCNTQTSAQISVL